MLIYEKYVLNYHDCVKGIYISPTLVLLHQRFLRFMNIASFGMDLCDFKPILEADFKMLHLGKFHTHCFALSVDKFTVITI